MLHLNYIRLDFDGWARYYEVEWADWTEVPPLYHSIKVVGDIVMFNQA